MKGNLVGDMYPITWESKERREEQSVLLKIKTQLKVFIIKISVVLPSMQMLLEKYTCW